MIRLRPSGTDVYIKLSVFMRSIKGFILISCFSSIIVLNTEFTGITARSRTLNFTSRRVSLLCARASKISQNFQPDIFGTGLTPGCCQTILTRSSSSISAVSWKLTRHPSSTFVFSAVKVEEEAFGCNEKQSGDFLIYVSHIKVEEKPAGIMTV